MEVKLLVEGGAMKPGPALSQQLGPAGINMGQVISKINEATSGFKGLKVPVTLDVDTGTKTFEISVSSPPMSELIKKEIGLEKGSGLQAKEKAGNIAIEQLILVAKTKLPNLLCNDLKAAVKEAVGTCASLGLLIENKEAVEIEEDIEKGKYDSEIKEEKTEVSQEKKSQLKEFFDNYQKMQQQKLAAEQAAEKEESPEEGEAKEGEKTAENKEEKKEEKK
ncbi:MAG: 50S ribosomal protein L11 [Nanoarchaeota archaeon]